MQELILRSSYADIYVDRATGKVNRIDYEQFGGKGNEWDDIEKFDPSTLTDEPEMDVLDVGAWTKDGKYFGPAREVEPARA